MQLKYIGLILCFVSLGDFVTPKVCKTDGLWTSPGFAGQMIQSCTMENGNATFTCSAKMFGRLTIGWSRLNPKTGESLPIIRSRQHRYNHNKYKVDFIPDKECQIFLATLTVLSVTEQDEGSYVCELVYVNGDGHHAEFAQTAYLSVSKASDESSNWISQTWNYFADQFRKYVY